ncbi:lipid carrier protein [Klebsiella oxytoca]|nr:lipid carrier protein [Klebsiella oxytoca]
MLDKLRSQLVHFGPSLISVPVKLAPFALKRQVLEQVLSWQFRQALADGGAGFSRGALVKYSWCVISACCGIPR